ncbi:embryonic polyadenylate-binding protein 2 [Sorex fumeus]|uniref:embryonic polyadenylate-binding protein 2 n=1 Tax=Sorex fumeus TaxID=62283 RepID=UPI0024AE2F13|nr:embryonic polyadenylate-binding protein 2 [Sorex fumeus]
MWPLSSSLFPPPSEDWLQRASSDPAAQGWGAWGRAEVTPAGVCGEDEAEVLLSVWEGEDPAECPAPTQELEAMRRTRWAMERAMEVSTQGLAGNEDTWAPGTGQRPARRPPVPGSREPCIPPEGWSCPRSPTAVAADHRSVYVGNVDYGGSALELGAHFTHCGDIHRVTILCDKFSGHPKGYAYIEFASESSVRAAQGLDCSVFRGRILKVLPKRTNIPGISSTDRGGLQRCRGPRGGASSCFRPQRWSR